MARVYLPPADFRERCVRANPLYRYVEFSQLDAEQLYALGDSVKNTDFAGVFVGPASTTLNVKAAPANVAGLAEQLQTPLPVSKVLPDLVPDRRDELLAGLVLDGVLEIEGDDGFVNQSAACDLVADQEINLVGDDVLSKLSVRALEHAEQLAITETQTLAAKLYFYHRLPASPVWAKLWPDAVAVLRYLGAGTGSPIIRALSSTYLLTSSTGSGWISWRHKSPPAAHSASFSHKLYVSPKQRHLKEALAAAVDVFTRFRATSFKVGADAAGLLRPDKFVIYFANRQDLLACAEALCERLRELEAHGVPFTTALDEAGLISWGVDPPVSEGRVGQYIDDSWRTWLCNRLAIALHAVDRTRTSVSPCRYALMRLWYLGVDTRTWTWREGYPATSSSGQSRT